MIAGVRFSRVTDEQLMRRVQEDDTAAFAELYDRFAPGALRLAGSLLGSGTDRASDAVQESFLSLWSNRAAYRPDRGEVHAWALRIVRNQAIGSPRRHRRHDRRRADDEGIVDAIEARGDVPADAIVGDDGSRLRSLLAACGSA